jgi:hypothetical protein
MGCFYTGYAWKQRKYGYFKIGETSHNTPAKRLSQIRQEWGGFECLGYLILTEESYAERLFIESYVRMRMSQESNLTQQGNDYFRYSIQSGNKNPQAKTLGELALHFAIEACQMQGICYTLGTKKYTRG